MRRVVARLEDAPYEIVWIRTPHLTPRAARLSAHEDYDGHSGEKCIVVHLPGMIVKFYPKPAKSTEKK